MAMIVLQYIISLESDFIARLRMLSGGCYPIIPTSERMREQVKPFYWAKYNEEMFRVQKTKR